MADARKSSGLRYNGAHVFWVVRIRHSGCGFEIRSGKVTNRPKFPFYVPMLFRDTNMGERIALERSRFATCVGFGNRSFSCWTIDSSHRLARSRGFPTIRANGVSLCYGAANQS